jgi:hypothetical protein
LHTTAFAWYKSAEAYGNAMTAYSGMSIALVFVCIKVVVGSCVNCCQQPNCRLLVIIGRAVQLGGLAA